MTRIYDFQIVILIVVENELIYLTPKALEMW